MVYRQSKESFEGLNRRMKMAWVGAVFIIIYIQFVITGRYPSHGSWSMIKEISIFIVITSAIFLLEYWFFERRMRRMRYETGRNALIRRMGKRDEHIPYREIQKIVVRRYKDGKILSVQVSGTHRSFMFGGLNGMDRLLKELLARNRSRLKIPVVNKRVYFDNNKITHVFGFLVLSLILLTPGPYFVFKTTWFNLLASLFFIGSGIYFLISRPFNKLYPSRFYWTDICTAMFMFIGAWLYFGLFWIPVLK